MLWSGNEVWRKRQVHSPDFRRVVPVASSLIMRIAVLSLVVACVFGAVVLAYISPSVFEEDREGFEKIVGGERGSISDFPWLAVIRVRGTQTAMCGASILSSHWLVSAAHCFISEDKIGDFFKDDPKDFEVLSMTDDLRSPAQVTAIELVVFPSGEEAYRPKAMHNDIILVKVRDRLLGQAISLPPAGHTDFVGLPANVSGFGALREDGKSPMLLQFVQVMVLNDSKCRVYKHYESRVNLCAGDMEGRKDSCQGDSGGPLVVTGGSSGHTLIGIVSYGRGCARKGFPGVYTRVSSYIPFIMTHLRDDGDATAVDPDPVLVSPHSQPHPATPSQSPEPVIPILSGFFPHVQQFVHNSIPIQVTDVTAVTKSEMV